jgi:fatty acid desaturase
MQHHRFTNDERQDPDDYAGRGPRWQRLPRWMTVDLYYMVFYVPKLRTRPRGERVELATVWLLVIGLAAAAALSGHLLELVLLLFIPARLATLWLGFAFDYLPHNRLNLTAGDDRFKATRNRIGFERLLSPLLLYQNYHLVHHLHPVVPFHRYIAVWPRARPGAQHRPRSPHHDRGIQTHARDCRPPPLASIRPRGTGKTEDADRIGRRSLCSHSRFGQRRLSRVRRAESACPSRARHRSTSSRSRSPCPSARARAAAW